MTAARASMRAARLAFREDLQEGCRILFWQKHSALLVPLC